MSGKAGRRNPPLFKTFHPVVFRAGFRALPTPLKPNIATKNSHVWEGDTSSKPSFESCLVSMLVFGGVNLNDTVDGRNPAPPGMKSSL